MKLNQVILGVAIFISPHCLGASYDARVNCSIKPTAPVMDAVWNAADHEKKNSRTNVVSQAISFISGTNEWWMITCQGPLGEDGCRTNFWYFVDAHGVREKTFTIEDRGVPDVAWSDVLSAARATGLPVENIVSIGWVFSDRIWLVRFTSGEHYELDKRRRRLVKTKMKKLLK